MRLTKSDKQAFVRAVLDDLPTVDYDEIAREKIQKWAFDRAPIVVQNAYKAHPEYISKHYYYAPGSLCGVWALGTGDTEISKADPEFNNELMELSELKRAQAAKKHSLECDLRGIIETCSTLKKAKELLPEFIKYLPAERDGVVDRTMPAISNIVAQLTEAGWPKDQPLAA